MNELVMIQTMALNAFVVSILKIVFISSRRTGEFKFEYKYRPSYFQYKNAGQLS